MGKAVTGKIHCTLRRRVTREIRTMKIQSRIRTQTRTLTDPSVPMALTATERIHCIGKSSNTPKDQLVKLAMWPQNDVQMKMKTMKMRTNTKAASLTLSLIMNLPLSVAPASLRT